MFSLRSSVRPEWPGARGSWFACSAEPSGHLANRILLLARTSSIRGSHHALRQLCERPWADLLMPAARQASRNQLPEDSLGQRLPIIGCDIRTFTAWSEAQFFGAVGMVLLGRHCDRTMERPPSASPRLTRLELFLVSPVLTRWAVEGFDRQLYRGPSISRGLRADGRHPCRAAADRCEARAPFPKLALACQPVDML